MTTQLTITIEESLLNAIGKGEIEKGDIERGEKVTLREQKERRERGEGGTKTALL